MRNTTVDMRTIHEPSSKKYGQGNWPLWLVMAAVAALFLVWISLYLWQNDANLLLSFALLGLTSVLLVVRLKWGIFFFFMASSFSGVLNRLSYSISPVDFQFLIALPQIGLFVVFVLVVGNHLMKHGSLPLGHILDRWILLYMGLGVLQTLNPLSSLAAGVYGFRLNVVLVLGYFLTRFCIKQRQDIVTFYRILLFLSIAYLTYGIVQQTGLLPSFEEKWLQEYSGVADQYKESINNQVGFFIDGKQRVFSIFSVSGEFQYFSAVVGILLWVSRGILTLRWERWLRALSLLLLLIFSILSLERTMIAMFILGIASVQLTNSPGRHLWRRFIFLGIGVGLFMIFGSIILNQIQTSSIALTRLAELLNPFGAKTVTSFRFQVWEESIRLIAQNPLGYGLGTATDNRASILSGVYLIGPHNYFLLVGIEFGVVGLLLLLLIIYRLIALLLRHLWTERDDPVLNNVLRGLVGVQVALWASAIFTIPFLHTLGFLYWFLMGLIPLVPRLSVSHLTPGASPTLSGIIHSQNDLRAEQT